MPLVSVVVPVYNGRNTFGHCIESLLSQEYPHDSIEVIIVDNNSNDGTSQIIKSYPVRILNENKQSAYAARNTGIRQANGEIVAFTDADCVSDTKWISQLVSKFTEESIVGVAGKIEPHPSKKLVAEFMGSYIQWINLNNSTELLAPPGPNVAYRRKALVSVGCFNETLFGGGDIDLAWRIQTDTGGLIEYNPEAIVFHKHRSTVKGLMSQYHRFGVNEIIITTIHKGKPYHQRTPKYQLMTIIRQIWAMVIELKAVVYRIVTWPLHRRGRKYLLWPLFFFFVEFAVVQGKLKGLIITRFFTRVPVTAKTILQNLSNEDCPISQLAIRGSKTYSL